MWNVFLNPQKNQILSQETVKIFNVKSHTFWGSGQFFSKSNSNVSRYCNGVSQKGKLKINLTNILLLKLQTVCKSLLPGSVQFSWHRHAALKVAWDRLVLLVEQARKKGVGFCSLCEMVEPCQESVVAHVRDQLGFHNFLWHCFTEMMESNKTS